MFFKSVTLCTDFNSAIEGMGLILFMPAEIIVLPLMTIVTFRNLIGSTQGLCNSTDLWFMVVT